jgi:hypothetical protein
MCGGSENKEKRVIGGSEKSPDPSTYTYKAMTPAEMDAIYRETGKVPYSLYGVNAPSSMSEYKAHRAFYPENYTDVVQQTTNPNQQTQPNATGYAESDSFKRLMEAVMKSASIGNK